MLRIKRKNINILIKYKSKNEIDKDLALFLLLIVIIKLKKIGFRSYILIAEVKINYFRLYILTLIDKNII